MVAIVVVRWHNTLLGNLKNLLNKLIKTNFFLLSITVFKEFFFFIVHIFMGQKLYYNRIFNFFFQIFIFFFIDKYLFSFKIFQMSSIARYIMLKYFISHILVFFTAVLFKKNYIILVIERFQLLQFYSYRKFFHVIIKLYYI